MNRCWTRISRALVLELPLATVLAQLPVSLLAQAQQPVPDAPVPQAPAPMSDMKTQIKPGMGAGESNTTPPNASSGAQPDSQPAPPAAGSRPPSATPPDTVQGTAPEVGNADAAKTVIISNTNAVEVPVMVKDSKGNFVAGLTWRDFKVYENNQQQRIAFFTVDPYPLSVAFVIDQSVTADVMTQINNSLGAIQGALTPYDEAAVFTYNGFVTEATGFTGGQTHRLEAVLALNKATGRPMDVPVNSGPLYGCPISANGQCVDPNIQEGRSAGSAIGMIPKEIHPLNDAILRAAQELSNRPPGRRRIIYVISDGKEYGSKTTTKELIKYLQTNKIGLYATLVGDSARWGEGYLSRFHLPFQMNDNVLPKYAQATGGLLDAERGTNGIERSYQTIAESARAQYTLVYYSHEPAIDSKYRSIEIRVNRPSKEVEVTAKPGYYPTAQDVR